jgi:hypothetical protein
VAVLTRSEDLACPSCHAALELSRHSRVWASVIGVLAGYGAAVFSARIWPGAAWVVSPVATIAFFGCGSASFLYFFADLVVRPKPAVDPFPQIHQ